MIWTFSTVYPTRIILTGYTRAGPNDVSERVVATPTSYAVTAYTKTFTYGLMALCGVYFNVRPVNSLPTFS